MSRLNWKGLHPTVLKLKKIGTDIITRMGCEVEVNTYRGTNVLKGSVAILEYIHELKDINDPKYYVFVNGKVHYPLRSLYEATRFAETLVSMEFKINEGV